MSEPKKGLELMREPFPAHQISKLPKPTKQQTEAVRANFKVGIRCLLCNAWHHPDVVHLDYVGHAALTDRLLDADPGWNWEPLAMVDGLPLTDKMGGMWIKLTVCGVTRLGYGHAGDKIGGDAIKEVIGDCLVTGTPITTKRGILPIESVKIGDMVLTRNGWRRVIDHWLSSKSTPTTAVLLANGRIVIGTHGHKIPTSNRGAQRMDALRNGDILYAWHTTEKQSAALTLNVEEESIGGTLNMQIEACAATSWQQHILAPTCTEISIAKPMAQPKKDGTYTTSMGTPSTTRLITSHFSAHNNTLSAICEIQPKLSGLAALAIKSSFLTLREPNGVLQHAKRGKDEPMERHTSNQKFCDSLSSETVLNVEPTLLPTELGGDIVLVNVVAVLDAGPGEVWNLSVEDDHEYVANGIFVFNCLRNSAMRFGAALDLWHKGDLHVEDDTKLTKSRTGVIKSTDGAADSIQDERRFEIDEIALHLIDCHNNGKDIDAFRIWYEGSTFKENEERTYCWSLLPSKLRSAIKANKPAVLQAMNQLPEKR